MDIPSYKIENVLKNYALNLIKNGRHLPTSPALSNRQRLLSFDGKIRDVINQISEKIINEAKELESQSIGNSSSGQRFQTDEARTDAPARPHISKKQKTLASITAVSGYQSDASAISEVQDA